MQYIFVYYSICFFYSQVVYFGHADRLLFHGLVNGHFVTFAHQIELVDAANAAVCQNQCASL